MELPCSCSKLLNWSYEPIPPKPWTGIWKAKTMFKCMQYDHFTLQGQDMVSGDEDCLYVNVYTPDLSPQKKFDVLIFIHGGAFMFNYGGMYGPELILDRDVVYVTLNYRLGPLGFLSTEDDVVPGNNGLKDQILALKWIKENIEYFGGNPNSITIFGMSAGGSSVHFHLLLPASKGLFHKGISQSGTTLCPWVLLEKPLEKAKKLSSLVGCPVTDSVEMVDCLRSKPARQITLIVKHFQPWLYNPFSPFGVVLDYNWATSPLLPDHPYKLLKNQKVADLPWMASYTSGEGLYPAYDFYYTHHLEYIDRNWNEVMPHILHYNDTVDLKHKDEVSQKIRQYFLQGQSLTKDTYKSLVELMSERLFIYDIEKTGRLHATAVNSPVYCYLFNYRGAHSKTEFRANTTENIGVSHGDDTSYILKTVMDTSSTDDDRLMCGVMIDMFTSFMRTGKPATSPDWEPLSKTASDSWNQLHIDGPHNIYAEQKEKLGNRDFWDSIHFEENDHLFGTKDEL
ncbi:hypothetical protein NQ318_008405 [Aromia moschata]|uniref:Carboxylic ester hydrolase n=1 Tax=Aromia moschata TaxID=1265417 RepID=A0AAV8X6W7_9CUCU|nr:hypothetical protein NQ318_008405 [Aromia moschata]